MQDPLKQGLKHPPAGGIMPYSTIRMQDPLKQGLKPVRFNFFNYTLWIRMQDPLKQGLKQIEVEYWPRLRHDSNARSTKTRIETHTPSSTSSSNVFECKIH